MFVKGEKFSLEGISRILLLQLGDIGDVVLATPALRALKENYPDCEIHVLIRSFAEGLIEDSPWVDGVISVNKNKKGLRREIAYQKELIAELRRRRFELALDFRIGTRGAILSFLSGARSRLGRYRADGTLWRNRLFTHLLSPEIDLYQYAAEYTLSMLAPFDLTVTDITPQLTVTKEKDEIGAAILRSEEVHLDKPVVALHPFSRWRYKELATEKYIDLVNHMCKGFNGSVVLTGSPDQREMVEEIVRGCKANAHNLAGKTNIGELMAVLKRCDLFIGIDSAALHIAAAVDTPTISIFGPSSPINWAPRGRQHCVLTKDFPCLPCRQKGCNNSEVSRCLDELTVEEVIPVISEKLSHIESVT